jgi:lipopolysaccharide export system protein LptA
MTRLNSNSWARLFALGAILGFVSGTAVSGWTAQSIPVGPLKGFKIHEFYPPETSESGQTNRLKTLLSGAVARPQSDGSMLVDEMVLLSFSRDGSTNLVARSPQCRVDTRSRIASSPGPLEVQTGQGQLTIQGVGFHCQISNVVLVLSNQVQTRIRRDTLQTREAALSRSTGFEAIAPGDSGPALTPAVTNSMMQINADHFVYTQASNEVVYAGNVTVDDPELGLTCGRLVIDQATNGSIDRILAEEKVTVTGKANGSRAYGDRGVYWLYADSEQIELTGSPARWEDGLRSGESERYLFDPRRNHLVAPQPSRVKLPKSELLPPAFGVSSVPGQSTDRDATNRFVEIAARFMDFKLPGTNQPNRALLASNEVVILSPADRSRAQGERASYSDATGIFELTGGATWQSEDRLIEGTSFFFERTNRTFRVRDQTHVRVPLSSLGDNAFLRQMFPGTNAMGTNYYLEVFSRDLDYEPDALAFHQDVHLQLLETNRTLGRMSCSNLTLHLASNRVSRIVAEGGVFMEQLPALLANGNTVEKQLVSGQFTVHLGTNGQVLRMLAETNVLIRQIERQPANPLPLQTDLTAEVVTAWFSALTNELERVVANEHVVIDQSSGRARGDQAEYTRATDNLVLSGHVTLETPNGWLNAPAAILKHFGLWPGPLEHLSVPVRNAERPQPNGTPRPPP